MYEKYSEDLDFLGESVNVRRCGVGFVNIVRSFFYKGNKEILNLDILIMLIMIFYEFVVFLVKDVNYLVYYIKEYKFIIKELIRESIYIYEKVL